MIRPPPRSTRTDTLCPYTTLFRSSGGRVVEGARLESEYTAKPYRGFESLPLRQLPFLDRSHPFTDPRFLPILGQSGLSAGSGPFTGVHRALWYFAWYRRAHLRSEEHTSELQSLMRSSYAVFCLKKKTICM